MNVIRNARTRIELLATALTADGIPAEYLAAICQRLVGDLSDLKEWLKAARLQDQNRSLEGRLDDLAAEFVRGPIRASVGALSAVQLSTLLNLAEDFLGDFAASVEASAPEPLPSNVVRFRCARPPFIREVIIGGAA